MIEKNKINSTSKSIESVKSVLAKNSMLLESSDDAELSMLKKIKKPVTIFVNAIILNKKATKTITLSSVTAADVDESMID